MNIRQATEADLDSLLACRVTEPVSWASEADYLKNLAAGSYRFEWTWLAEEKGTIVARAVLWGLPDGYHALELDCLYAAPSVTDRVDVCSQLMRRVLDSVPNGAPQPTFQLLLPSDWRSQESVRAAVSWRLEAVARAGLSETVERLRFEWTPDLSLSDRSSRLTFVEEPDDEKWIEVFGRVSVGSLDSATRRAASFDGRDDAARNALEIYRAPPGRRDWWSLAHTKQGELVGFAIPSRNENGHIVGYLGVLPEHRGRGYVCDLLAEVTHTLAEKGARRITADADVDNTPMVAAFGRLRYRNFAVRLVAGRPVENA